MGIPAKLKSHQPAIYPPEIPEAPIEWTFKSLRAWLISSPAAPTNPRLLRLRAMKGAA
jgi:hypothetical protein